MIIRKKQFQFQIHKNSSKYDFGIVMFVLPYYYLLWKVVFFYFLQVPISHTIEKCLRIFVLDIIWLLSSIQCHSIFFQYTFEIRQNIDP